MLHYRYRLKTLNEPPFRLGGTLIHSALAHIYGERMKPLPTWWTGETLAATVEREGAGYPDLIANAKACAAAYAKYWWEDRQEYMEPVAVEEEFRATVGELDPTGEDATLNDEVVTCKSDLVARDVRTGALWILDHKTKAGDWRRRDSLPVWDHNGEYALSWQGCINLHIVRRRFPNDVVQGFIVNRVKRDAPFDFDRQPLLVSPRVYDTVPRVIRQQVARERQLDQLIAAGGSPPPSYWECYGRYGPCDYRALCNADTLDEVDGLISTFFRTEEK